MAAMNYIHIGRNKCASTTLQYFFLNNAEQLAQEGVDYYVWGSMTHAFPNAPGFHNHLEYGAHIKANPDRATLISSEDFMGYGGMFARAQIQSLEGAPRRVIAYVRDYCAWIRSAYMETVMTGRAALDFDSYLRQANTLLSALPVLETWGKLAGWENMHVRSLDPANLYEGDVLRDCGRVLGISDDLVRNAKPEPKHVSPHWMCAEIIRHVRIAYTQNDWRAFTHDIVYKLRPLIERAIVEAGAQDVKAHYLTLAQAERFTEMYNNDVAALNRRMESDIPNAPALSGGERAFLPSIEHVPLEVLQHLMRIAEEEFKKESPPPRNALRAAFRWVRDEP